MLLYTHKRIGITKLVDFFSLSFFTPVKNLKISDFLDIKVDEKTNLQRLFEYYTPEESEQNQKIVDESKLLLDSDREVKLGYLDIKFGTVIYLPQDKLYIDFLEVSQNLNVENYTTFSSFFAEEYLSLLKSPYYIPLKEENYTENLRVLYPDIRVFLWSKSLRDTDGGYKLEGDLIDITHFVQSISTSNTKTGGNFQMILTPVLNETIDKDINDINNKSLINFDNGKSKDIFNIFTGHHKVKDGFLKRQQYFFSNIIQSNDIVFISFEKLEIETFGINAVETYAGLVINPKDLPGSIFDMMGLVDTNLLSSNSESNEIQINVSGRDFMKLLIEDGCYFYPQLFSQSLFSNLQDNKNIIERVAGVLVSPLIQTQRTIQDTLDLIFSVLKTMRVCDDILFSGYNTSSGIFKLDAKVEQQKSSVREKINSDRNKILENIHNSRVESKLTVESYENDLVVCNSVFNDLEAFMNFLFDNSYLQVQNDELVGWSDNNKSFVYLDSVISPSAYPEVFIDKLFVEQNLFSTAAVRGVYQYIKTGSDLEKYTSEVVEDELEGVWKAIRFIYDESIANRIIVDTSIGTEKGSLLSFIQKVCQEPLVEFFGDTYSDRYVFTVRQPPFTKEKIKDLLQYAIEISDSDILSDSPQWNEEDIYSWYKIEPRGLIGGAGSDMTLAYLSAVYFPEYAEIWGSRPLDVSNNYIPLLSNAGDGSNQSLNKWELQSIYDLKFLIDIHSYLPFTKKSKLIINGDRRIKRGTFIRLKNKGEVAYVEAVSNTFLVTDKGVDRITTLDLSRIMVEELIDGVTIDGKLFSYFNIIDTSLNVLEQESSSPPVFEDREFEEESKTIIYNPVVGVISSHYGVRNNPLSSDSVSEKFHNGTDIALKEGTPVKSPWEGKVISKYSNAKGGNQVIIEHTNGYRTGYAHLKDSQLFSSLYVGLSIAAGEIFSYSGNTGETTGAHLHFTLKSGLAPLDPESIFDFKTDEIVKTEITKVVKSVLVKEGTESIIPNDITKNWKVDRDVFNFFIRRKFLKYV